MIEDVPPLDEEILDTMQGLGTEVDPSDLIEALLAAPHDMDNVIEALQRAMERGKIALNLEGMVVFGAAMAMADAA